MSYVIGLDVGGATIKGAVFNDTSEPCCDIRLKTYSSQNTSDEILASMSDAIKQLVTQARVLHLGELAGIGIGVPGFVDSIKGVVLHASNLHLHDVNLKKWLESEFSVPCVIQGDARVGALAERELGAAKGSDSLLYIVIGTGVGSGMILDGQIYEGAHSAAGEIGHTILKPDGQVCACGKRGCLETLVSGPQLIVNYQRRTRRDEHFSAKTLSERAVSGDTDAKAVYRDAAKTLALALANYCTTLDPSIVVVGGGVSLAGEVLFEPLREFFHIYTSPQLSKSIRIVPAQLGDRSGIVGSGLLIKKFLQSKDR